MYTLLIQRLEAKLLYVSYEDFMVESSIIINLPLKNDRPYARFLAIIRSRGI
jgi:hypothetical protein